MMAFTVFIAPTPTTLILAVHDLSLVWSLPRLLNSSMTDLQPGPCPSTITRLALDNLTPGSV